MAAMKVVVLTIVLIVLLAYSDARGRYHSRSCVDCFGRPVRPGRRYYDGCNWCKCISRWPRRAYCTRMWCPWNRCYKRRRGR